MVRVAATIGRHYWLAIALVAAAPAVAQLSKPGTAPARGPDAPKPVATPAPDANSADPQAGKPIVPDSEFAATGDALPPATPADPELAKPLVPLAGFDTAPLETAADIKDKDAPKVRYDTVLKGLDGTNLQGQFNALSALKDGGGKAANATQVSARAKEDEALAVRLMKSLGYYDGTAISVIETIPGQPARLKATVTATPGRLYTLSSVDIKAGPVTPPDLLTHNLPLKVGDAIEAARIEGAEANVSLVLPQRGYPFVKVGERDILLDDQSDKATGAYTLPVETGARSSFGQIVTTGDPVFDLTHLNVFPRYKEGQLYD